MKWHICFHDRTRDEWVNTEVVADRCYIASSGVISFLNAEQKPKADDPPASQGMAPTVTNLAKPKKGAKAKPVLVIVRAFSAGMWGDLEKAKP